MSQECGKTETQLQDPSESGTLVLRVILHQGHNLKKTLLEKVKCLLLDNVMDPYILFKVTRPYKATNCATVAQSTSKNNDENPIWEEKFTFYVDESEPGQLQMTLWDSNIMFDSQMSDPIFIDLDSLPVGGDYERRKVAIHNDGEIEISLCMQRFE
jgi:Ca2+-dependent lipid-binding protein